MASTAREPENDSGQPMPDDLRDLLAALQSTHTTNAPAGLIELTRRIRAAAHRGLPANSPLRRSIDSEDLMQETVADLVRAASQFRGRTWGRFFAFTLELLQRRKVAHARRAKVRRAERDAGASPSELHDPRVPTPSNEAMAHDDAKKAARLLRELASPYREALELKLRGVPTHEIASTLGAEEGTVRKRIARALRMLKAKW